MMGSLLGGIVADALGSPYQFKERGSYSVTPDMEYCHTYSKPPGSFTDDSSMMLCLAESLATQRQFDAADQMERYWRWLTQGYMSSAPYAFDIGGTTKNSIAGYGHDKKHCEMLGKPFQFKAYGLTHYTSSGNGGIMRLAPVPVFYHTNHAAAVEHSRLSSAVTHASPECLDSAALLGHVIHRLLNGASKHEACDNTEFEPLVASPKVKAICQGTYKTKTRDQISTSGYVIDSLEAALWGLFHATDYEAGVMTLAAMGLDTDTVCCIFGQMAGALWGVSAIPERWRAGLACQDTVHRVCGDLVRASCERA
ncbi:hypothetical protein CHLNCDRAFT_49111 [Chlorella variabilis]|uniref:ADP-ribosylhydrolase ARH3 n=1 Tax=Chlorella variabilis TaxID=554065 RepID=E1ZPE6_CHLVA|nr:hypothetical protein CHLNCDRAFT_49111 [Chlorella variabilis]EFN52346.1 hypothetical protein CHLNCDRAFT_49111 [Chlorella variabilis]|eukprot:XP_005844448.1 hypothetical protein CHLNCDRAFT_49111 [Chlorella variabilis]